MKDPVGFVGLGNMGLGMARNILKAGFPLIGHDAREEPLRVIEGMGGQIARHSREVFQIASSMGWGKEDDSAVVKAVEMMAG